MEEARALIDIAATEAWRRRLLPSQAEDVARMAAMERALVLGEHVDDAELLAVASRLPDDGSALATRAGAPRAPTPAEVAAWSTANVPALWALACTEPAD